MNPQIHLFPTPNIPHDSMEELTPMLRQYRMMKQEIDEDVILLFRVGDFYEIFMEDARIAAPLLGITLTKRAGQPLCGIPHHALDSYLAKLLKIGRKVAICDQMEDPKLCKGKMVRRDITRIITPGTITEENILQDGSCNYIVAARPAGNGAFCLVALDLSTGEFFCEQTEDLNALAASVGRLAPGEAIVPQCAKPTSEDLQIETAFHSKGVRCITPVDEYLFDPVSARDALLAHFRVASLDGFGCEGIPALASAAGALLRHVHENLRRDLSHIRQIRLQPASGLLILDETTSSHLNLFPAAETSGVEGASLLEVIDSTCTPMGKRLLRKWLARPLCRKDAIDERLDTVDCLIRNRRTLTPLRETLANVRDLSRTIARISLGRGNARDLLLVSAGLKTVPSLANLLDPVLPTGSPLLASVRQRLNPMPELTGRIDRTISDEPPANPADGGTIRPGFNQQLDKLRDAQSNGRTWIGEYQSRQISETGIKSLKVRFNKVFGYFIEIPSSQLANVPASYQRKQTIVNGERFTTAELKEREELISGAEAHAIELEQALFAELVQEVVAQTAAIQEIADAIAQLDVFCALADRALALGYVRPEIRDDDSLEIRNGRHPIIEQLPEAERFVPNDTLLNGTSRQIIIITGPNMAGKSTYIRQVALIVILAQIGSFVPADSAAIGLVDRVFTRVGAADDIARGRSTFLVEMQETANILNNATPRSLIVLDEIGRGTSTFDGISIAWAVAEYLHNNPSVKARTLFATHYHELTDLPLTLPGVVNCSVLVRERNDTVVFLRRIVEGPADKSYGIAVAKLAGMPEPVLSRAREILQNLESNEVREESGKPSIVEPHVPTSRKRPFHDDRQMMLF